MSLYAKMELPEQDTGVLSSRLQSLITPSEGNSHFAYRLDFCILWHLKQVLHHVHKCPKNHCLFSSHQNSCWHTFGKKFVTLRIIKNTTYLSLTS